MSSTRQDETREFKAALVFGNRSVRIEEVDMKHTLTRKFLERRGTLDMFPFFLLGFSHESRFFPGGKLEITINPETVDEEFDEVYKELFGKRN